MARFSYPLGLAILVVATTVPGCSDSPTAASDRAAPPPAAVAHTRATAPLPAVSADVSTDTAWGTSVRVVGAIPTTPVLVTAASDSPDPAERLQALETWAKHPGASLDPVTYAMVDPDESVRARAQELWEQNMARR